MKNLAPRNEKWETKINCCLIRGSCSCLLPKTLEERISSNKIQLKSSSRETILNFSFKTQAREASFHP